MLVLKCPVFLDARKVDKVIQARESIKMQLLQVPRILDVLQT